MKRATVFKAITEERNYQDQKWGTRFHDVGAWLLIMESELEEAKSAWCKADGKADVRSLEEIIQVAAIAVACLEHHALENQQAR